MKTIEFKEPVPLPKLIYGTGLFVLGIATFFSNGILGIVPFILGFYFLISRGIEFDFSKKKYRTFKSLFNIKIGKWESLPEIDYVSVFRKEQTSRVWVSTASTNITETIVKVNLFYNGNHKITVFETPNLNDAFDKAKKIANSLNVDILDATERESKWL